MDRPTQGQGKPVFLSLPHTFIPSGVLPFFTTRTGGRSRGDYESFNLGLHVGDEAAVVHENRALLLEQLQPAARALCLLDQVHGTRTVVANPGSAIPEADALVTRETGVALGIMTADCAPVLLYDPVARVVGAAHAGWRGALNGIVESCIDAMESLGGDARHMHAIIGPVIRPPHYEVDEQFFLAFHNYHKLTGRVSNVEKFFLSLAINGRFQFNLANYINERLQERGVPQEGIKDVQMCTFQNENLFFSYRRSTSSGNRACGRQIGGIVLL
ncbi:MAG: peptidoglycan editing factor PgeF [Magnetococcales bacterium]|nr:peptidoglycan editing factor PgeF [Magnetococcales bacterium]MBF0149453.1 peptidoglycan editing factor PgeF [Magnetococcales bacterium]MBF0171884.1 peptidoglycan editing factor PgeF [Magnetococcales bacterium]MBF0346072.1 peptidoglycan editing factor PgeF [Magnetococcales bacterium]MBF0632285.1 peptidoglycan editing factor PgeF [Magnetococcales bacterium]